MPLRAQPADAALAVGPLVGVILAGQAGDQPRLEAWLESPVLDQLTAGIGFPNSSKKGVVTPLSAIDGRFGECCTALVALQDAAMTDVLTSIVRAYGRDLDVESSAKIRRYLRTLASAGNRDSRELTEYGLAYLQELDRPDRRYTGC